MNLKKVDIIWLRSSIRVKNTYLSSSPKVHGVWENKVFTGEDFRKAVFLVKTWVQLKPEHEGIIQRRWQNGDILGSLLCSTDIFIYPSARTSLSYYSFIMIFAEQILSLSYLEISWLFWCFCFSTLILKLNWQIVQNKTC